MTQVRPLDPVDPDNDPTLRAVWESAADAIAVSDAGGIVRAANPAYYQFYGYTPDEVLGQNFAIIYEPERRPAAQALYQATFAAPEIQPTMTSMIRSKDGTQRIVEVRYTFLTEQGQRTAMISIIRDVTAHQQARAEAELERRRLHDLFMQVPAAVVIYRGPDFIVDLINPTFEAMLGTRLQVGQQLLQALPHLRGSLTFNTMDSVYRTGKTLSGEEVRVMLDRHGDGNQEEAYFNFVTQPTRDLAGQVDGVVVFALDVTAQVLARRQVEELADQRQQALQMRDEFLSIASHELKTPITSIKGLSQLLLRRAPPDTNERLRKGLQTITAQSDRLTVLINEVLDISRLETGQFSIEYDQLDLGALITEVAAEVQLLTDTHVITVDYPPTPVVLRADRERLRQVLVNLLENAVKYTPAGGPVQVQIAETADRVTVAVQDQGIGIPADQAEQIFQRFYRARNVTNSRYSGLGLGLYISHEIIARHGGQLTVESQEGQGTTVAFWLPRHPPKAAA